MRDLGGVINTVAAVRPQDSDGTAINGIGIDRLAYLGAVFAVEVGATSGTPTSFTVDAKVQESDDNSTYADVAGAAMTQITAINSHGEINVSLAGLKRYVRLYLDAGFTGGTAPKVLMAATCVLGQPKSAPV